MFFRLVLTFAIISLIDGKIRMSVEEIQKQNIKILKSNLENGWKAFCDSPVDEGVMSLYRDINPSDATIHIMTVTNQSVELPIKSISEIRDFDIDPKRKTLVYVNAFYAPDNVFTVQEHLVLLQKTRRDLNIIIVDFVKNIQQMYYAIRHHVAVQSYFVYKVLNVLIESGIAADDITLAGHSVGANIAALSAYSFIEHLENKNEEAGNRKIGQLIAIDPSQMCGKDNIYVNSNISERVIVIHGEGNSFGIRSPLGTLDIYPNGVGFVARHKLQPGCDNELCSHMYPFLLFMEALIEGAMIPVVKCESWVQFRRGLCKYNDKVVIGLKYPISALGSYFCMTRPNPPYTLMEYGLKFKHKAVTFVSPVPDHINQIKKKHHEPYY